jgi:hypothetical protein
MVFANIISRSFFLILLVCLNTACSNKINDKKESLDSNKKTESENLDRSDSNRDPYFDNFLENLELKMKLELELEFFNSASPLLSITNSINKVLFEMAIDQVINLSLSKNESTCSEVLNTDLMINEYDRLIIFFENAKEIVTINITESNNIYDHKAMIINSIQGYIDEYKKLKKIYTSFYIRITPRLLSQNSELVTTFKID